LTQPPGRGHHGFVPESFVMRNTPISVLARAATFGVPHSNECPHLTTYPRKIKHLHDDT
jgi:hypothetical protein